MFDTWSKNNKQKCWADLHTRLHSGSFSSDLLDIHTTFDVTEVSASYDELWQSAGNKNTGKHLKPTSLTNTLFSTTTKQNMKKNKTEKLVMLFTQLSLIHLDLNYKHTSTSHVSNLHSPFESLLF